MTRARPRRPATAPSHGIVRLAWLDLRAAPDHRSEMKSQLLLGEVVEVRTRRTNGWWRVENRADRYRGWVRAWGIAPVTARRAADWSRRATARVAWPSTEVSTTPRDDGIAITPLPLNARIIPVMRRSGAVKVALPDGRSGWVPAEALSGDRGLGPGIVARVTSLLGVPYLWGGRTPSGFDCSGFTQQVLLEAGCSLPRDAHQQWRSSRALGRGEQPAEGDLVFFARPGKRPEHVGLWLQGGVYAHCRGQVGFNSLDKSDKQLYDKALGQQFLAVRRPRPRPAADP